jgi:hypothetical protein
MISDDQYRDRIAAVEAWANTEADRLGGSPPVSACPKTDDLLYAAVYALSKRERNAKHLAAIESTMVYLSECVESRYYEVPRPTLPDDAITAVIDHFEQLWSREDAS